MSAPRGDEGGPLVATPGQTVGPFFHDALPYPGDHELVVPGRPGAIRLHGVVRDGAGDPVPDALVELWQADARGRVLQEPGSLRRDGWRFTGFGRSATDGAGEYTFSTVPPGPSAPGVAAFVTLTVFARGLLHRLLTRAYLPAGQGNSEDALARDPLLLGLEQERRASMLAVPDEHGLRFDVHLQGSQETVFLTYPRLPPGG